MANLLGAAATARKRLAVMAALASERLAVTEVMSSKCTGCEAAMFAARLHKRLRRSFVLYAEFDLYSKFVSES